MTGSGTLADPYVIWDVNDLRDMNLDLTAYYELGQDIDASATVGWTWVENALICSGFRPIGQEGGKFTGHFDGKGYSITGLYIDRSITTVIQSSTGLFGNTEDSYISNVRLVNFDITGSSFRPTGALAGKLGAIGDESYVTNCGAINCSIKGQNWEGGLIGQVVDADVEKCFSTGEVIGKSPGGLIGLGSRGVIRESYTTCDVTGNHPAQGEAGGFAARIDNSVYDCYARGNVVEIGNRSAGGFCSYIFLGTVERCYSTGQVSVVTGTIGGLVATNNGGTITDSFWDTETSGMAVSDGGTGQTTAQMKDSVTFISAGWGFGTTWGMTDACNNGYPCLLGVTPSCAWAPAPVIPTVTTDPATAISQVAATENGSLDDDGGEACECGFEWGLTPAYGQTTLTESKVTGETFSQVIGGLFPGTTYYFRGFATNSAGTGYGAGRSFTTTPTFSRAHALSREEL